MSKSLKIQAIELLDIINFEDGNFKRKTKAKFVGKSVSEMLNEIDEKE